jgi:outer membrane protein assembly factor BamB
MLERLSSLFGSKRTWERPYELVDAALQAWARNDEQDAERLFREGIEAYRKHEPGGADFALGRYAAFLLARGRLEEAREFLDEAIQMATEIPAIWHDYLRVLAEHRDLPGLFLAVDRMVERLGNQALVQRTEILLQHGRRADREGDVEFAEALARRAAEEAGQRGDQVGQWAAIGDLGHFLERADRVQEAVNLWFQAFQDGSNDPVTVNRLSMHLERSKQYDKAVQVVREGLQRGLPANTEEQLRKRLLRCESKLAPGQKRRTDVPAFSERGGAGTFRLLFQVRTKPPVRDLEIVGNTAHCLGQTRGVGVLIDIDLNNGAEMRRREGLPEFSDIQFTPTGYGLGVKRTGRIGESPTLVWFLDPEGSILAETTIPDATSQVAYGSGLWYVGCRNGRLYAFDLRGEPGWSWEVPGARNYEGSPYMRPCPYYVVATDASATVASMGSLYAISPVGQVIWQRELPNERQTRYSFSVPIGDLPARSDAYRTLQLPLNSPYTEVKRAYRQLAMATHPDRNPQDPDATAKFRQVQSAYETISANKDSSGARADSDIAIEVSIEISGMGPLTSFLAAGGSGVVAGSSQGRLYLLDGNGQIKHVRALGNGPVQATLHSDGTLAASLCDGAVSFFRGDEVINIAEFNEHPRGLKMLGEDLVLWGSKSIDVMNREGQKIWSTEFSRSISGVATHRDSLICAAGVLAGVKRVPRSVSGECVA